MWSRKPQTPAQSHLPSKPQSESSIPPHQIDAYEICTSKCLQTFSTESTLPEKSCFNRCIIKYTEALKFTIDHIRYQNYELKRSTEQHYKAIDEADDRGFLEKFHDIYEQQYGKTSKSTATTA